MGGLWGRKDEGLGLTHPLSVVLLSAEGVDERSVMDITRSSF